VTQQVDGCASSCASRRAVLAVAGAAGVGVALSGCQAYGQSSGNTNPAPAPSGGGGAALGKTADIPVGGGKVFPTEKVVVTQPTAGTFKAFSAICTHQGCTVANVTGGTINCECHGSKYKIADGSVAGGPAPKPLPARAVTVEGDSLKLS
jgi:nitrite reductase/ring-hydroxylating ferredoxin subunit